MKKIKKEKGITLVALIITIVVLLILAAVAIGSVKNSDIISHSKNASSKYEQEKGIENNTISGMENLIGEYAPESTITYADFWKAAYEKIGNGFKVISNHIAIGFGEIEGLGVCGQLIYGDYPLDSSEGEPSKDPEYRYFMSLIDDDGKIFGGEAEANQWYSCTSGSDIDFSSILSLPEEISTNKSGTPFSGYEDLCKIFDEAVGTEGCAPYVANEN